MVKKRFPAIRRSKEMTFQSSVRRWLKIFVWVLAGIVAYSTGKETFINYQLAKYGKIVTGYVTSKKRVGGKGAV